MMLSFIKSSAAIEPQTLINSDSAPSMADNVFGEQPVTEPLNSRVATIGYDDMTPLDDLGTVSVMFAMQMSAVIIMLLGYCCSCTTGSMCCKRLGNNLQHFALWGSLINLIMVCYLPVVIATFISVVGLQWDSQEKQTAVRANNIWTLFMLFSWLLCPLLLFFMLYRNRK